MGSTQDTQDAQNSLRLIQWVCACCAHRSRIIDQWLKNWQRLGTPVTRATRDHPQTYPVIIISVIPYHATSCSSLGIIWVPLLPPLPCWASPASEVTWTARCLVKTATGTTAQQPASHRRSTESSSGGGLHHCKLPQRALWFRLTRASNAQTPKTVAVPPVMLTKCVLCQVMAVKQTKNDNTKQNHLTNSMIFLISLAGVWMSAAPPTE